MQPSELTESKGEFAKRCNVSPGRVSQWIKDGQIGPEALVGEGRSAKILIDVAVQQLQARRDVGQAVGNGLDTRLERPVAPVAAVSGSPGASSGPPSVKDPTSEEIKRERLWALQAANREVREKEAARLGIYTETATVRAEMGRISGQMMRIFEGALPELATAIAAEFKLDARDVTHLLGEQFRKIREAAAATALAAAQRLPETVPSPQTE